MKDKTEETKIKATVHYNGIFGHRQRKFTAETEEELLTDVFWFYTGQHKNSIIEIKHVDYNGKQLPWSDFLAHQHFAKNRINFQQFKEMCFETAKTTVL